MSFNITKGKGARDVLKSIQKKTKYKLYEENATFIYFIEKVQIKLKSAKVVTKTGFGLTWVINNKNYIIKKKKINNQ